MTTLHAANSTRWLSFKNISTETIPSYGVFSVVDIYRNDEDKNMLLADQYKTRTLLDDPQGIVDGHYGYDQVYDRVFAINGRSPVAPGRQGMCTFAYDGPAWARWKPDIDAPNDGNASNPQDQVGPHPNSFGMTSFGFGFRILQYAEPDGDRIFVQQMKPETTVPVFLISEWVNYRAGVPNPFSLAANWCFGIVLNSGGIESGISGTGGAMGFPQSLQEGTPGRQNCIAVRMRPDRSSPKPAMNGMVIEARWRDGTFYQTGGGAEFWPACEVIQGALVGEQAIVDLRTNKGVPSRSSGTRVDENYHVYATASDPTFVVPTGVFCDVMYSPADGNYYIVAVNCPGY